MFETRRLKAVEAWRQRAKEGDDDDDKPPPFINVNCWRQAARALGLDEEFAKDVSFAADNSSHANPDVRKELLAWISLPEVK